MGHDGDEWRRLQSEFIEAAAKYENEGYKTFIQRTARGEEYYGTGRYNRVAEIKWPYRPWRTCWILAPSSGTNEEPFAVMKTLFTKAWLWLPRVVAGRIVDAAAWQLSPRDDVGLLWANSHYEFWCWLLWFDWLWRCGEVETEEPESPPAGMDLRPFSSSVDLIGRWGLDGSAGTFPVWLSLPTAPDPESPTPKAEVVGGLINRLLAGPDDAELSPREMALLEAYLKQQVSLSQIQREVKAEGKSEPAQRRNKLKLIRDFNRNLQAAIPTAPAADPKADSTVAAVDPTATQMATGRGNSSTPQDRTDDDWFTELPDFIQDLVSLELTTPPPITKNLARATDGRYFLVWWDSPKALYRWSPITADSARELAEPVRQYRGLDDWEQIFVSRQPRIPDNIFRLDNDTWTIRFNGGDLQTGIKNSMPARDICFLLANAGKIKSIYDLPDNRGLKPQTGSTPVATKQDYQGLQEQIKTCLNLLENDQDPETQDDVKKTLDGLRKQQNENFDRDGKPRQLVGDTEKVVRNTQVRVRRFYNDNSRRMPELVTHLRQLLDIDGKCLYKPDTMNWDCGEML